MPAFCGAILQKNPSAIVKSTRSPSSLTGSPPPSAPGPPSAPTPPPLGDRPLCLPLAASAPSASPSPRGGPTGRPRCGTARRRPPSSLPRSPPRIWIGPSLRGGDRQLWRRRRRRAWRPWPPPSPGPLRGSYWDERFGKEEHYEWFKDFSHFCHLLAPLLSPSLSVLEVRCGNSRLGEELLREGVTGGITCIDLSPVVVQWMRDRLAAQGTKGVDVVVADMLDLPFEPESFDLVVQKGTMDGGIAFRMNVGVFPEAPRQIHLLRSLMP